MSHPTPTAPVIAAFNPSQQVSYHHADFVACSNAAAECRRWAQQYLAAAECYQAAANHAAAELSRALQLKWAMAVQA